MPNPNTGSVAQSHPLLECWVEQFLRQFTQPPQLEWTKEPAAGLPAGKDAESGAELKWVEHIVHLPAEGKLWLGAAASVWQELGTRAGVSEGFIELLNRTIAGVEQHFSSTSLRQMVTLEAKPCDRPALPEALFMLQVEFDEGVQLPLLLSFDSILETQLQRPAAALETRVETGAMSLLMDLEVPVSISFGRTQLALKDVLNLAGGSIVELNRSINDLVDLVVDQRVVARGEVVVIDGNYGIRIAELVATP